MVRNISAATILKIPNERFNKCVVTLSNPIAELGYEAPFEIVFFQIKTSSDEYERAQEALKKKAKKPYPTQ